MPPEPDPALDVRTLSDAEYAARRAAVLADAARAARARADSDDLVRATARYTTEAPKQ